MFPLILYVSFFLLQVNIIIKLLICQRIFDTFNKKCIVFLKILLFYDIVLYEWRDDYMKIVLLVISILLIIIVLLQSGKAEPASQIISGGNMDLFSKRKERGSELVISRITLSLGILFFAISLIMEFI